MKKFCTLIKYTFALLTALAAISCSTKQAEPVNPSGEKEKTIYTISVEKDNYTMDAKGGKVLVSVTHNVDVSVSISADAAWVKLKGSTPGTPEVFEFNVEASKVESERKCTITFNNSAHNLSASATITQQAYEKGKEPEVTDTFDPENIVYSFANLSDIHMSSVGDDGGKKFISALQQLQAKSIVLGDDNGLDAVMISGDMTNNPGYSNFNSYKSEFQEVKKAYESVFKPAEVPLIYTPGNHDVSWTRRNIISESQAISDIFGGEYFLTDEDKTAKATLECRHCVIDDFHVICITPESQNPVGYSAEALNWLDKTLASITSKEPDRYVFVLTHPMVHDTVYGSLLGPDWLNGHCSDMWYSMGLTPVLIKYPQVVAFSGHLHFPINDPRSIWQGKFTAIGCGSCRYMAIEDGEYDNMSSTTVMSDAYDISTGYLTQIDFSGNIRITRMFFSKSTTFGEPWYLSHPNGSNSHLNKYNHDRLKQANGKPSLGNLTVNQEKGGSGRKLLTICFNAATDDEFVHDYVIILKKGSSQLIKKNILADYYKYSQPSEMKKKYEVSIGSYQSGDYTVSVTATDSWGASATSTLNFSVESEASEEPTAAYLYSDINFSGSPTDAKAKASITNNGAVTGSVTVSHGGLSKSVDALSCGVGKYATGEFPAFSSSSDFRNFAHNGFSVETFYIDKSPGSDIHGIFCGTEKGGWGLAVKADGTPYFVVGDIKENNYIYLYAKQSASTTDLTHIVGVYDFDAGLAKLYVNGQLNGSTTITGPFYPATNGLYNKFCLGADVAPDGVHFPCSNMIIVDARMYSGALTDKEVSDAYQTAVNMLK